MLTTLNRFSTIDHLFDRVWNDVMGSPINGLGVAPLATPSVEMRASEEELCLCIDVPGLKEGDLELTVENGVLTVKGERKYEGNAERGWSNRRYGTFSASYQLPDSVDSDRLTAHLADGVLTIRAPKHERAKPKKVQITAGPSNQERKQLNATTE
jgi:HSP20 family protein